MSCVRILGPVEAWADGTRLELGGPRQLALLAVLAVRANRAVSSDELVEALWGETRAGGRKRLQMAVARLRQTLAPLDRDGKPLLRTVGGGYLLALPEGELDADVFRSRLEQGRAALRDGTPARASELLSEALQLWRGPPLADVGYEEFAQAEIRRLEESRLLTIEARVEAELQLGRHAGVIAELEGLLVEQPSRERIAGQLMLALYRSGRQADALEVYQRVRAHLAQELGLQPGPELVALQARILESDATLLERPGTRSGDHAFRHRPADVPRIDAMRSRGGTLADGDRQLEGSAGSPASMLAASLPVPATPFLGRERELALATALMRKTRLLTLTGAGGSGKTRLALRLAEMSRRDYNGGVVFVGFADINDVGSIIPTISQALGLGEVPGKPDLDRIQERLAQRELLLVLDNLEQLTTGTGVLGDLLSRCPGLSMLVTSREPLHLAGEQQYEVPVLDPEDAIELFLARTRATGSDSSLDHGIVASICERLDRLPLAIELTAARAKTLAPVHILERLERRLPVAATGPRDAPQRQRTLQATIDWSYNLLTLGEQQLFTHLSVFAGGCTFTAAQSVCGAHLDTLHSLVDRSLIKTDGERYWMLQTLRDYALGKLALSGEADQLRRRHARWFVELLQANAVGEHLDREMRRALVGTERENFRAALEWTQQAGESETLARLAVPLSWQWRDEGRLSEVDRWLSLARERSPEYALPLQAGLLSVARMLAQDRGNLDQAVELADQALALYRELGDVTGIFWQTTARASMSGALGDLARARAGIEQALQFAREQLPERVPDALGYLADLEIAVGRLDRARACCEEVLSLARDTAPEPVVVALINLAHVANLERRSQDASGLAQRALITSLGAGFASDAGAAALQLAWSLAARIESEATARLLGAALEVFQQTGVALQRTEEVAERAVREALHTTGVGVPRLQALIDEGRIMGLEEAVEQVLNSIPPELAPSRDADGMARAESPDEADGGPNERARSLAGIALAPLPSPATPFLGRERELVVAAGLLHANRLLTLTGAGGSGKTRLALRLAETCRHDYTDGAAFVALADITDPELIIPTISQTLGLGEVPGKTPMRHLQERLGGRGLLLVLDNLEQLTHGTSVLGELSSACSGLKMLVTSREPLHLAGEQQYEVPLLEPDDAIELFVTRARAVVPDLEIDRDLAGHICEHLDWFPLAIELTAARTKLLSPPQILDRIQHHLPVTTTGPRDAPQRQRTLTATIDWSYQLLTPEEQQLFARLSVFAGGCTLTAAHTVCGADLDTLHSLVDRSLIKTDGERHWMLRTLREYALERLEQSGEGNELRRAHAQFLVDVLEAEGLSQPGWPDARSLGLFAPERENFTAALEWAASVGMSEMLARLAEPLVGVWVTQGRLHEANRWMNLALEGRGTYSGPLAARVLLAATVLARHRGDHSEAGMLGALALARWREVGDALGIGVTLLELSASAPTDAGHARETRALFEQAIQFARDNHLTDVLAAGLANLSDLLISIGSLTEARTLCEESRAASASGSSPLWVSTAWVATSNLAYIEMREGRHTEAARLGREALQSALARGDLLALAWGAIFTAWSLAEQNQLGWSARLLGAALGFLKTAGATRGWMDRACEAAVLDILYSRLDPNNMKALFEEGRNRGLETVVRDVLSAAIPPIPGRSSQALTAP